MTGSVDVRTDRLRRMLEAKRHELVRELERELGERVAVDLSGRHDEVTEIGDRSVTILGEDLELGILEIRRRQARQIDDALRRLHDGAYGICEGCGAEIGEERLTILPFATRCVECKQQAETAEKRVEPTGRGFRAGFRDLRDIDEDLEPDDE